MNIPAASATEARSLEHCRICGSARASVVGRVEFYSGYPFLIYDCASCHCRLTLHDSSSHELLHANENSRYGGYREWSDKCKALFEQRDAVGLRQFLCRMPKYRLIIETVEHQLVDGPILEVGCARGHLASYFILTGKEIIGIDVSSSAVEAARVAFGNYFMLVEDKRVKAAAPYGLIYHTGMIGCVPDPIHLTNELLGMLKAEARLVFNAPNALGLTFRNQMWPDSAPPPDVVTLFTPGFWTTHYSVKADVRETIEVHSPDESLVIGLRKILGPRWRCPRPTLLSESAEAPARTNRFIDYLWRQIERVCRRLGRMTGVSRLARPQPTEFGLFVTMIKK